MRRKLGEDPDIWGLAGLLHDYDWEIHPTLDAHPKAGMPLLAEAGAPEAVLQAILAHNEEGTGVARREPIDFALLACDEVTGLVIAAALVRPSKDVRDVELKSIQKRWKEKLVRGRSRSPACRERHRRLQRRLLRRRSRPLAARRQRPHGHAGGGGARPRWTDGKGA
jgi:predicted hydrolase (HD superfamily)